MPIKIKVFLTVYIIVISICVMLFEKIFGDVQLISILFLVAMLMVTGIWIFPEVVTKNTTANDNKINK
jgi:hypothetical protein|tara:strand:- start:4600 stop:4803 length:204 start_codon:yes stop_codon:yes gene_type:complete